MKTIADMALGRSPREKAANNRYMLELGAAMAAYAVILVLSRKLLLADAVDGPVLRAIVSVSPVLPLLGAAWAIIRHLRRVDEFQRHVQMNALAVSVLGTALVTITWGFLENVGAPKLPTFMVWPILGLFWGVASFWINWRHRATE